MKREGRQHGMVRTYRVLPTPINPRPEIRFGNRSESPTTAGLFARVSARPTNHSKFTGKCGQARCNGCHLSPSSKARDKSKGAQKIRSCDVVSNYRLLTWRAVDARPGLNLSGSSATMILDHLCSTSSSSYDDHDDGYDDDDDGGGERVEDRDPTVEIEPDQNVEEVINGDDGVVDCCGDDMSFCDVGFVLEQVEGDDGWCLVGEM